MNVPQKQTRTLTRFGDILRRLRKSRGLRHRAISTACGISYSTACNLEGAPHKILSIDKVNALIEFYRLPPALAAELLAAWNELPMSEYHQKNRAKWERRNALRQKGRLANSLTQSLIEVLSLLITYAPESQVCTCGPADVDPFTHEPMAPPVERCEVCAAMLLLGIEEGWTTHDVAIRKLCDLQKSAMENPSVIVPSDQSKTP